MRLTKTVGGVTHYYNYDGNLLISEEFGDKLIIYIYDETGSPIGLKYREKGYAVDKFDSYIYGKNLQGDITEIFNENGTKVVEYKYDAWGNIISTTGTSSSTVGAMNPFRYRGYYYDCETEFYYLHSRYYDPATGRFVNADDVSYLGADNALTGYNLYSYCNNNPVMYTDESGHSVIATMLIAGVIGAVISGVYNAIDQIKSDQEWDWKSFGLALAGGFVSGAISAIPITGKIASMRLLCYGLTFLYGGLGAVCGGVITGSVHDSKSAVFAFVLGGTANIIGKVICDRIANVKADKVYNQGYKARSLEVQKLQSHPLNMGSKALKGHFRNAFKQISRTEIMGLITNANPFIRHGIYSVISSSSLSGWY